MGNNASQRNYQANTGQPAQQPRFNHNPSYGDGVQQNYQQPPQEQQFPPTHSIIKVIMMIYRFRNLKQH